MSVKFSQVMTRADWIKITLLVIVAGIAWAWVWYEYQKPWPEWPDEVQVLKQKSEG